MKKLKIFFLLSQKFCYLLKISSSYTFFINCSKTKCGTRTAYFCLSSSWHFWKRCWAVEIRADAFRAVDPDSFETFKVRLCQWNPGQKETLPQPTWSQNCFQIGAYFSLVIWGIYLPLLFATVALPELIFFEIHFFPQISSKTLFSTDPSKIV